MQAIKLSSIIPENYAGMRLDQALAKLFPDYSRTRLKNWLVKGQIKINQQPLKPRDKIAGGELVEIEATLDQETHWEGQNIALEILHEDEDILVINKPAGMVVHPAAGNYENTLLNALLHYFPSLTNLPRAGIVHRLDKDTSGLLVIAKNLAAHTSLVKQLQAKTVYREYAAIVCGVMTGGGTVDQPIGRHPIKRQQMSVRDDGKPAVTHYRIAERFSSHTYLKVILETGRTHQIRVHMAYIHYPLLGDPVYAGRMKLAKGNNADLSNKIRNFKRQALHAYRLNLVHPSTHEEISWEAPLPEDLKDLIEALRSDNKRN